MFRGRRRRRRKDHYNPDQPCHLLSLSVEPCLFEKIFTFLDHRAVSRLELTCTLLRDLVIQTKVYRRKFRQVCGQTERTVDTNVEEKEVQESCFYKNKLFEHFHRY